jgi:hypothetical protein
MRTNQALRETDEARKKGTLNWALQEFQFVKNRNLKAYDPTFPFWPQLFIYESKIYMQLGQTAMALRALQQAAEFQKRSQSGR